MIAVWLKRDVHNELGLVAIDLPIYPMASAADMWSGTHDRPESIPSQAVQCLELGKSGWSTKQGRRLIFVLTGQMQIREHHCTLYSGDVILLDADIQSGEVMSYSADCRVLILHPADWEPRMSTNAVSSNTAPEPRQPNFKWLYSGSDGQAYFSEFDELFDESRGWGATLKPVYDTMLIEQADGFFMDWHPEGANNIVVILTGELELEAAGGGQHFERFGPGDICFAVDRTGQGHIDRARGPTLLATIVVPTKEFTPPSA